MRRWTLWCVTVALTVVACHSPGPTAKPAWSAPSAAPTGLVGGGRQSMRHQAAPPWVLPTSLVAGPMELAGYTDRVSVRSGQSFRLYVTSTAGAFTVRAFRVGWYSGRGARLVWTSPRVPGRAQPRPTVRAADRMVSTSWHPSLTVPTRGWPPGTYLLLLTATNGKQKYVPITVRSSSTHGAIVLVNAVNTYQAYNAWGGYSLYTGPNGYATRSYKVSFDRPYDGNGAPNLIRFELPMIQLAEESGVPLAYLTSVDLASDPTALAGARGVVSLGHDEYWTSAMRAAVTNARNAGTNVAFLGGNAVYWRVRYEASPLGPDRVMVGYKDAALDPVHDRPETTVRWRSEPFAFPENSLTGMLYVCDSYQGTFVVRDPGFFLFAGTGVVEGTSYRGLAVLEVDRAFPMAGTPADLQVVAQSPVTCGDRPTFANSTYYTVPSGAGVFDSGTMNWIPALGGPDQKHGLTAAGVAFARKVTVTLLQAMAVGPLGRRYPAHGDLATLSASS